LAGLVAGAGGEPQLAPLAAGYVLALAILGPVLMRSADVVLRVVDMVHITVPHAGASKRRMT
ncbi:MAG: hypothetical protein QOF26_1757, partial [Baekduia sp.]|nr:hypothetical protein [Baekduia sp.]